MDNHLLNRYFFSGGIEKPVVSGLQSKPILSENWCSIDQRIRPLEGALPKSKDVSGFCNADLNKSKSILRVATPVIAAAILLT